MQAITSSNDMSPGDSDNPNHHFAKNHASAGNDDALAKDLVPHEVSPRDNRESLTRTREASLMDALWDRKPVVLQALDDVLYGSYSRDKANMALALIDKLLPKQPTVAIQINMGSLMSELADKMTRQ